MRTFEIIGDIVTNSLLHVYTAPELRFLSKESAVRKFLTVRLKQRRIPKSATPYFESLLSRKNAHGMNLPIFGTLEHIAENYRLVSEHDKKFASTSIKKRLDKALHEMKSLGYDLMLDVDGASLFVNQGSKALIIFNNDYANIGDQDLHSAVYISVVSESAYDFVKTFYDNGIYAMLVQKGESVSKFVIVPNNNAPSALIAVGSKDEYEHTQKAKKQYQRK